MRTLKKLLETRRMFYLPMYNVNSLEGLHDMIREIVHPHFVIAEVGSFAGVSSDLFARYCRKLYCIDIWNSSAIGNGIEPDLMQKGELMFDKVWLAHRSVIEPIQSLSTEAAEQFEDGELDMVYIDGRHDYSSVKEDIHAWLPKIRQGGWITGHDMGIDGVQQAVEEVLGTDYKTYADTSWAIRI